MSKEKWLDQGYAQFAMGGPASLKVEPLAAHTVVVLSPFSRFSHFQGAVVYAAFAPGGHYWLSVSGQLPASTPTWCIFLMA